MQLFYFILFALGTVRISSAPAESTSSTVQCYDCHYDPSALKQKDHGDWTGTGKGGFPRCSLKNNDDHDFLNKYGCTKGKCFIRRDPNGQVFRGCADPWNLPWGVDASNNCQQQNDKSFWWFCEGELCNDGRIDDEKRCENIPKVDKQEKETTYHEEQRYTHGDQNSYQPSYYQADHGSEYKESSASISVTLEHDQDSPPVSVQEPDTATAPIETVYGNEYSDPKAWYDMYLSKFSNDPNTNPHYHKDSTDFEDSSSDGSSSNAVTYANNDNVYYSRTQGRYVSYGNDGPAHYYTDSELSYNTDGNYNRYDYILPDDYGRSVEYNSDVEHTDYATEPYYPELYKPEDEDTLPVNDYNYSDNTETNYKESKEVTIDGGGYFDDAGTYNSYNEESGEESQPSYDEHIPQNWYYQERAELAAHHFPYGWHPYYFPWLHDHYLYRGNPNTYKQEAGYSSSLCDAPEKSHPQPPKKSHYESPKKSHPPPPHYEPPNKSQSSSPKKSHYEPPKESHPPAPKKSHYEPPKKSHAPTPKKSHYQPPKKSHPPAPKKSHYQPPKKSPPKKSQYEAQKKSHAPTPKKSHYQPPKKSHPTAPKKSHYEPPKKSHPVSKKSLYEPPKKSHFPTPKNSPKKSHPESPKKSSESIPNKSHPPPRKSHEPEPKKSYAPPPKSDPQSKGKYQPPTKSPKSDPQPKGKYQPPAKSQPAAKKSSSSKKVFEPDDASAARDENTVYSLGDNLQVLGTTLIHVDDAYQDGDNAYAEIDQDNADNFAREYDDSDLVYYEYEYEDDNIGNNNIGTGDLYDPNSLKDDTAYYYEYSHKLPVPSEKVQSLCSRTCGLYPHPDNNNQFVQCGPGVHYGQSCDCCHAYEHSCSEGTTFDAFIGVCGLGSDSSQDHTSYKTVDYY